MAGNQERTFIMVKPDGVQRGLVGEILKRFEAKGFKLVALKMTWVSFIRKQKKNSIDKFGHFDFNKCHMAISVSMVVSSSKFAKK